MWRDNENGLSSTGLLRPTDSSSAIRRNHIIIFIHGVGLKFRKHTKFEISAISQFKKNGNENQNPSKIKWTCP